MVVVGGETYPDVWRLERPEPPRGKKIIGVSGNIGAGKSVIASAICNSWGWKLFEERVNRDLLGPFYEDKSIPSDIAAEFQFYMRHHRSQNFIDMKYCPDSCVQDRTVLEDRFVFALKLHAEGRISDSDLELYMRVFDAEVERFPLSYDSLIYVDAPIDVLIDRIKERNRPEEIELLDPSNPYLRELDKFYKDWIREYEKNHPVLVIPSDELNFRDSGEDRNLMLNILKAQLEGKS